MSFVPRPYQQTGIDSAVQFFTGDADYNAFQVYPTGAGKSVVIASIAKALYSHGQTLVFQPSKEILEQNYKKFRSYGYRAEMYSAAVGSHKVGQVTFATIGSVIRKKHLFEDVRHIIVDECHGVNADAGMYQEFLNYLPDAKILGLTATPYRLESTNDGPQLNFINRTTPRIFDECLYYIQTKELFDAGHLAKLDYQVHNIVDRTKIRLNAQGTDFDEKSLRDYYDQIDIVSIAVEKAKQTLKERRNLLIFAATLQDAYEMAKEIEGAEVVDGELDKAERERILNEFKKGTISCVINVGVLTTGFDYPELEAVMMVRSTMSLSLYYQIVGRGMRPHEEKHNCAIIDLGGNVNLFGRIETMEIRVSDSGLMSVWNTERNKQLTNVPFSKS